MGVEDVGAHYTIYFSLCVQISGGEKALKKNERVSFLRENLTEYKASKTGQLVKNDAHLLSGHVHAHTCSNMGSEGGQAQSTGATSISLSSAVQGYY